MGPPRSIATLGKFHLSVIVSFASMNVRESPEHDLSNYVNARELITNGNKPTLEYCHRVPSTYDRGTGDVGNYKP
jgi:hypothetical protein